MSTSNTRRAGKEYVLENGELSIITDEIDRVLDDFNPGGWRTEAPVMLVVEDDDVDAEVLLRIVEKLPERDWRVLRARTLAAAVKLLDHEEPDVALVDLNLADAWYGDAVMALVDAAPECPIIVQTGFDDPSVPAEMLKIGAQDFLQKGSITVDSLNRSIRHARARHQTLGALRRTWARLAKVNAELDEFAHIVAHDLRAPARTARMLGTRLLQELPPESSPLAHELGGRLDQALGDIDTMILSMLDYAGLRSQLPGPSSVDLASAVSTAADMLEADLAEVGGSVLISVEPGLSVFADASLMQRVIHNLLGNSIKYRDPSRRAELSVTARDDHGEVEILFVDNGTGIPAGDRERVFELLERLHHSEIAGHGFGLAICRRIVNSFGGTIRVSDHPQNNGCTVIVRLPKPPATTSGGAEQLDLGD